MFTTEGVVGMGYRELSRMKKRVRRSGMRLRGARRRRNKLVAVLMFHPTGQQIGYHK